MSEDILKMVPIPSIVSQDYPVDVYIRFYRREARYDMEIQAVGKNLQVPLNITPKDLEIINEEIQSTMEDLGRNNLEDKKLSTEESSKQLREIAEVGNYAFKRAFSNSTAIEAINNLLSLQESINIQIASEDFSLPWELIYPFELNLELSYEKFWGMNYIISRVIVQNDRPGAFVPPTIYFESQPKLGLLSYGNLPSVAEREIPYFEKLAYDGKITLLKLRALDIDKKTEEFEEFKGFCKKNLNIAHFACHAYYESGNPFLSNILLSDKFSITLKDMETYGLVISGHPLVILNACETGNLNPLYTFSFASAFLKYGARGVVASECEIPDEFAADFAEHLYSHLLNGEALGQSLLVTRKYFLKQFNNPTGLLYSMYAPPAIKFIKS